MVMCIVVTQVSECGDQNVKSKPGFLAPHMYKAESRKVQGTGRKYQARAQQDKRSNLLSINATVSWILKTC